MKTLTPLAALLVSSLLIACGSEFDGPRLTGNAYSEAFSEMVAMRDGVLLASDVKLPERFVVGASEQVPAILMRTPYGRTSMAYRLRWTMKSGIATIIQDTRGRYDSEGVDTVFQDDGFGALQDGYDTVEWIAAQPWSNGKVCTSGSSAMGITQTLMAPTNPPALVCQFIQIAPANLAEHAMYQGGILREELATTWLEFQGAKEAWLPVIRAHDTYDDRARSLDALSQIEKVNVPAFFVGGWFDIFSEGTLAAYRGWQHDAGEGARGKQKLVMGPMDHIGTAFFMSQLGRSVTMGTDGINVEEMSRRWLAHHLLGEENGITEEPTVRFYIMEGDQKRGHWETAADWPPPTTTWTLPLNAAPGLGAFSGGVTALTFVHDPNAPIPTVGGRNLFSKSGAFDQVTLATNYAASRLLFLSEPLAHEVTVAGEVIATIRGVLNGADGHWTVQLLDVTPDGRHLLTTEGSLRAQMREGREKLVPVTPGAQTDYEVSVYSTAWRFLPGHRIGLSIAGSNAPRLQVYPEARKQEVIVNGPSSLELPVYSK